MKGGALAWTVWWAAWRPLCSTLRQTFSRPLANTLMVNEYIKRYAGFDGFFTKSNVTLLTKATENQ